MAALKGQWCAVAVIEGEHFADKNHMVAAFILKGRAALKPGGAVLQQRCFADAVVEFDFGKLVLALHRKTSGQRFLFGRQHMHVPVLSGTEHRQAASGLGKTPQHQRRVKRHRIETIGRNADGRAIFSLGGDDRHPGGKGTQRGTECLRVETALHCHDEPHGLDFRAGSIRPEAVRYIVLMD